MKTSADQQKRIESMLTQLRLLRKRSETTMKKLSAQIIKEEKKYQKELSDFQKMYGA